MPFCGHCGAESPSDKIFCGDCGKPIVRASEFDLKLDKSRNSSESTDTQQWLLGCLGLLVVTGGMLWWSLRDSTPTVPAPRDTRPSSYYRTAQLSFCSPSEDDARIAARAIQANDTQAIEGMMRRGKFLALGTGTRARWIWERPPGLVEVRIDSGEHAGITCFTPGGYLEAE